MGDLKTPKFHSEINWPLVGALYWCCFVYTKASSFFIQGRTMHPGLIFSRLTFTTKGHSITTWTKFYPILTTYPPQVGNCREMLHTSYPLMTWPNVDLLLSTNLPHLSHIVIEWPPMYSSRSLSQSTYSVCLYSTSLVIMRISDIRMISQSENYHAQILVMSPSRAGSSHSSSWRIFGSARLVTFFTSARNQKLAQNEPKFDFELKTYFWIFCVINLYWKWLNYAARSTKLTFYANKFR